MFYRIIFLLVIFIVQINAELNRSFTIDYQQDTFLKDGQPFRYISGSLHYFRVPQEYWEDRLRKYRKAGLNTVQTYVEWSLHEPYKGQYDFAGDNDLFKFIELAQKEGLLVILRVGPYICAERSNGGIPFWLKKLDPKTKVRTADPSFMNHVEDWFNYLIPKLKSYLYKNGGPVILMQIENEYGSYAACDFDYQMQLKNLVQKHLNDDVVLFTTDGPNHSYLKCGQIAGVLPAIDFGTNVDPMKAFRILRQHLPNGPLINNEFYPGWLDHWAEKHNKVGSKQVCDVLDQMLLLNSSVNFYMLHGGTSFGFTAGANTDGNGNNYQADITSYDYDAPINEFGNLTQKYFDIQNVIRQYAPVEEVNKKDFVELSVPPPVEMKLVENNLLEILLEKKVMNYTEPQSFEKLNIRFGYVLYRTTVDFKPTVPARLLVNDLRDRAYIYIDGIFQGILSRSEKISSTSIIAKKNSDLMILVEDQGRVNFGPLTGETKGISDVFLGNRKLEGNWMHYATDDWNSLINQVNSLPYAHQYRSFLQYKPRFFKGEFELDETIRDTLIDTRNWSKGAIWVNDRNLGKFWPNAGPQQTLYLPGVWLKRGKNTIILLEQEADQCMRKECKINFTDIHLIDSDVPIAGGL